MIFVVDWVENERRKVVYKSNSRAEVCSWVYSHQELFRGVPIAVDEHLNYVDIYDSEGNLLF